MVTLDEMKAKRKIKVLLKGLTGSGKTFSCMKIVDTALKAGKKVLYMDHERGAIEEILKYFEENKIEKIDNFNHEDYFSLLDLVKKIKDYKEKMDLIIIDPLPLLQICRISAEEEIKKQGFYYLGEKLIRLVNIERPDEYIKQITDGDVDNKTTYSLRGWQYSLPNSWELSFKDILVSMSSDIVCTLLTPDTKNSLDPCFDYVIELSKIDSAKTVTKNVGGQMITETIYEKIYRGIPRKIRGERITQTIEMENPWKSIIKPFERKYLGKEGE